MGPPHQQPMRRLNSVHFSHVVPRPIMGNVDGYALRRAISRATRGNEPTFPCPVDLGKSLKYSLSPGVPLLCPRLPSPARRLGQPPSPTTRPAWHPQAAACGVAVGGQLPRRVAPRGRGRNHRRCARPSHETGVQHCGQRSASRCPLQCVGDTLVGGVTRWGRCAEICTGGDGQPL